MGRLVLWWKRQGYERKLVAFLQAREIAVAVVNPKRVRDYANAMGAYAKMTASTPIWSVIMHKRRMTKTAATARIPHWSRSATWKPAQAPQPIGGSKIHGKQHLESATDKDTVRSIKRIMKQLDKEIEKLKPWFRRILMPMSIWKKYETTPSSAGIGWCDSIDSADSIAWTGQAVQ